MFLQIINQAVQIHILLRIDGVHHIINPVHFLLKNNFRLHKEALVYRLEKRLLDFLIDLLYPFNVVLIIAAVVVNEDIVQEVDHVANA